MNFCLSEEIIFDSTLSACYGKILQVELYTIYMFKQ